MIQMALFYENNNQQSQRNRVEETWNNKLLVASKKELNIGEPYCEAES